MISIRHLAGVACALVSVVALIANGAPAPSGADKGSIFEASLRGARDSLGAGRLAEAYEFVERALLRDPRSADAWLLRAEWAAKKEDKDEQVYALHQAYRLKTLQKAPAAESKALAAQLTTLDPVAADYFKLRDKFLGEMLKLGQGYEKENRPHSAIRAYRQVLALEPDHPEATTAIERVSARPDASLAETAKPKDLLADVSQAFMADHDSKHESWKTRAKLERDNYVTQTDAGYEVMVRTGEAMEQMSRFYRKFFHYAEDKQKGGVPRIDVLIFKNRDEYLKLGSGPPVEWSGGQFTGGSVETYVGAGGFEEMTTTLFHEAAHQFVSLATSASGWLNEGLASFFEGTRILANGTVVMNMPANHRLFPLVTRMKNGWMKDYQDGIDPSNASAEPKTAPTWEIILENKYAWGPPWYAPTWGVVYFLYDYQDPVDGRFVYRAAFREFIDESGGVGESAIAHFEKVVLSKPSKATPGYEKKSKVKLPQTCAELDVVWKDWMNDLAKEQSGLQSETKPYQEWAECALIRREPEVATEHFEKGLLWNPDNVELLMAFSKHLLDDEKNPDRATKLLLHALAIVEHVSKPDEKKIDDVEDLLARCDPKRSQFKRLMKELAKGSETIVQRYIDVGFPLQAMELASRLGTEMQLPSLFDLFEKAARMTTRSIARWQLVYNEENLRGWASPSKDVWMPYGSELLGHVGAYDPSNFDFNFMTCDKVTSGDYSIEAEVYAEPDKNVFCGIVFGRKSAETYHQLALFPGHRADPSKKQDAKQDQVILGTLFGGGSPAKDWEKFRYPASDHPVWHKIRVDVVDRFVDMFIDGEYIVTHDFGSPDVLSGSFGLAAGHGDCRFRNVKFQPRERNDLGAKIERKIRLEKIDKEQGAGPRHGRWQGKVPYQPKNPIWLSGAFKRYDDLGSAPKLLVFWNIAQNENIRIDGYLNDLFARTRSSGLEIISFAHWVDKDQIPEYLKTHPFPGRVAVDHREYANQGSMGDTFDQFNVGDPNKGKNGMPWFVLLDVDDVACWEGDPGFVSGQAWKPGDLCIVDDAINSLVETRKLKEFMAWRERWRTVAKPALAAGDFEAALPELKKSLDLSARAAEVAEAARFVHAIEVTADDVPSFASKLTAEGAEPVLRVLYDWAARIEHPVPKEAQAKVASLFSSPSMKEWEAVLKKVEVARAKLGKGDPRAVLESLSKELESLNGVFTNELKAALIEANKSTEPDAAKRVLEDAKRLPSKWLVRRLATP